MIKALTAINCAIACFVWAPTWRRLYRTKSAKDFSVLSLAMILYLQASNLTIAISEKAAGLTMYMALNTAIMATTVSMVVYYQGRKRV